jgi:hypothetical protein
MCWSVAGRACWRFRYRFDKKRIKPSAKPTGRYSERTRSEAMRAGNSGLFLSNSLDTEVVGDGVCQS